MQSNKIEKKLDLADKIVSKSIMAFFALILAVCGYVTLDAIRGHSETRALSADAESLVANIPDESRISELQKTVNPEIKAWIELENTDISFPITQGGDNAFYLTHNFRRDYANSGSIFADFRSNLEQDDYSIIYGHNMNGEMMFGPLKKFAEADYFNAHASGKLYLSEGSKPVEILAYAIVDSDDMDIYELAENANGANSKILQHINALATQTGQTRIRGSENSRLMLLSTCYNHSSKRAVLLVGF